MRWLCLLGLGQGMIEQILTEPAQLEGGGGHYTGLLLLSCQVISSSLQYQGLQHTRLPCPSLFPRVCSNSCPLSHLILCCPVLLQSFPALGFFPNESALCIRWPKYWSFSISPSNEYSGLISFRIDWFDLLAVLKVECSGLWSSGKVPCG